MFKANMPGKGPKSNQDGIFPIEGNLIIDKVTTQADGGFRMWVDLDAKDVAQATKLMALHHRMIKYSFIEEVK